MSKFTTGGATRLADRDYFDFMLASVETATSRILTALFLHDIRPPRDVRGQVLELTMALVQRHSVGVDVRVLLSGHVMTPDISVANLASGYLLQAHGVPHRRIFGSEADGSRGLHSKFVICDDVAVVGSQNWTDDAFSENIEDAVILTGEPADQLSQQFAALWASGRGLPNDAS